MKILILSDLHNEFYQKTKKIPPNIEQTDADVIILAGDIWVKLHGVKWAIEQSKALDKPIIYILGNHEFYGGHTGLTNKCKALVEGTNVHVLERDELIIGDTRFLGATLWTDFSIKGTGAERELAMLAAREKLSDYRYIRVPPSFKKLHPRDTLAWHYASVSWLRNKLDEPFDGNTVVISHHAPHLKSEPWLNSLTPAYVSDLSELMDGNKVQLWAHGHTHIAVDYEVNGTRVVSNPKGYLDSPVEGFDSEFIVNMDYPELQTAFVRDIKTALKEVGLEEITKEYGAALAQLTDDISYADLEANDRRLFERWQLGATQPSQENAYYWDYARYAEVREAYQEQYGDLELFEQQLHQHGNWTRKP